LAGPTFKQRVESFWTWYASVADRFYRTIEDGKCASLADEVSQQVDRHLSRFSWVFGPGANGNGHAFTLTAEGDVHRQLLTRYWWSRAPHLPGWTFYPARQPGPLGSMALDATGERFNPLEFWLTPHIDEQEEKIDLNVWHPLFDHMPEDQRGMVLFLFLDEALGEYGTQQWIGEIKFSNQRLAEAMPLTEILELTAKLEREKGWKKFPPGELGFVYEPKERHRRFLRGDTVVGSTVHPRIVFDYLDAEGRPDDPLAGTGADFVFVAFSHRRIPQGEEAHARGAIQDALDEALEPAHAGRALGGAHGVEHAYIDLLLYDGANSIEIVRRVLRQQDLPPGATINYFAKEKADRVVRLD
jgi:hypothetical protein